MNPPAPGLARLARPSGAFAMVAVDHREALRGMFHQRHGRWPADRQLRDFKVAATELLSPWASALLLDRQYGLRPVLEAGALVPPCGLIVAADELIGPPGAAADDTRLDEAVDPHEMLGLGVVALKLLVFWRPDGEPAARRALVTRFLERCHEAGLLAIIEGVAKPPRNGQEWDREAAILAAAREFGALRPDLYKGEVPLSGRGDPDVMRAHCEAITRALDCPWVVLSSGVDLERFPAAVGIACEGGASGFLAGRAVWADALETENDERAALSKVSVPRLKSLCAIVDAASRRSR